MTEFTIKRCSAQDPNYIHLVQKLDQVLADLDGEDHAFYAQYNQSNDIKEVVIIYSENNAVACGALRKYSDGTVEIKRMFVDEKYRGKGISKLVLCELEQWAIALNYSKIILETGHKQKEAIQLYSTNGYYKIPNYGPYKNIAESYCFEKIIFNKLHTSSTEAWDRAVNSYVEKFNHLTIYQASYEAFIHFINKETAQIFEFASGPGTLALYMLHKNPQWKWVGSDFSLLMIQKAKELVAHADFIFQDVKNISQKLDNYNGVIAAFIIPYLNYYELTQFIQKISKEVSESTYLYFSFVEGFYEHSQAITNSLGDTNMFYYYTVDDIEKILSENGLHILKIFKTQDAYKADAPLHIQIIAQKVHSNNELLNSHVS